MDQIKRRIDTNRNGGRKGVDINESNKAAEKEAVSEEEHLLLYCRLCSACAFPERADRFCL